MSSALANILVNRPASTFTWMWSYIYPELLDLYYLKQYLTVVELIKTLFYSAKQLIYVHTLQAPSTRNHVQASFFKWINMIYLRFFFCTETRMDSIKKRKRIFHFITAPNPWRVLVLTMTCSHTTELAHLTWH